MPPMMPGESYGRPTLCSEVAEDVRRDDESPSVSNLRPTDRIRLASTVQTRRNFAFNSLTGAGLGPLGSVTGCVAGWSTWSREGSSQCLDKCLKEA